MNPIAELDNDKLKFPPSVRRLAPDCFVALIEASVRSQFGIPDLTRSWFSHSFVYSCRESPLQLEGDGQTLGGTLVRNGDALRRFNEKLRRYHGVETCAEPFSDFGLVLRAVRDALMAGELVTSSFGIGFLKGWHAYGKENADLGHYIIPTRLDEARGKMSAIENIRGAVEIDLEDYAASFRAHRARGRPFMLVRCRRDSSHEETVIATADVREDLGSCLDDLRSACESHGLNAFRRAVADIRDASERFAGPLEMPHIWMFANDRHALEKNVPQWQLAGAVAEGEVVELTKLARRAAATWRGLHALMATPPPATRRQRLEDLDAVLASLVRLEERVAASLEGVYHRLSAG